ncbi:MAG: transcription elongation factor Spt5 [Methanomassiliicoccaceae archaeon]|jgi:transcriptional antiterminator NusG|nr:transcription elongation factor Spt5 [Methanomassiliicoccaceae archaeon]
MSSKADNNSSDRDRMISAGSGTTWKFETKPAETGKIKIRFDILTGPDFENAPEWNVTLYDSSGELWSNYRSKKDAVADTPGKKPKELKLEVIAPKGARYGDYVEVDVFLETDGEEFKEIFRASAKQSIMILKTQIDQEKSVVDSLLSKAQTGEKDVFAILSPANLRGYVFVEGMNTERLREKTRDIRKARSFVDGETSLAEIDHYLTPLSTVVGIVEGDLVELINGPFKGEKARVQHIDGNKEEITVELIEAMVPIPVTVKGDSVRIIEKEK